MKMVLILFFPIFAFANFDFNYGASARSYPSLGGGISSDMGYSYLLRGSEKSPFHSLIRAGLKTETSFVVNQFDPNVIFYPLGFIGIGAGKKYLKSSYEDFTYYDCNEIRCSGDLNKGYKLGKIALAFGPILTTFNYTELSNNYSKENSQNYPVAEYRYALEVNPEEESQVDKKAFLGYKIDEKTIIGISTNKTEFLKSNKTYDLNIGVISKTFDNLNILFGAGTMHSSDIDSGGVIIFRLKHQILPNMAIF